MKNLIITLFIVCFVSLCIFPMSCRVTDEGIVLVRDDYSCPTIESYSVTSQSNARIVFSDAVNVVYSSISPSKQIKDIKVDSSAEYKSLCFIDIEFEEPLEIGKEYKFCGEVKDKIGNSLTFSLPFTGYNESIPELIISEVHPKYASSSTKNGTVYKCEYIELYALSSGNTYGLELYSAYDGDKKAYKFPPMEIQKGMIIIVHLRTKGEGCISETPDNIKVSTAKYSSDNALDLWDSNENARLGDDMDVILLKNYLTEKVMDCVCYGYSSYSDWKKEDMKVAVSKAVQDGKWDFVDYASCVKTDGTTPTKSISRVNKLNNSRAWKLSEKSGETPGVINF